MSTIDALWLAYLNRNTEDAGSDSTINLTINVDGEDVFDRDFDSDVGDGEAYTNVLSQLETPFDSAALTNSSVRIGVRDDDAWAPGDVLVFGQSTADFQSGVAVPLAMETGLTDFLSTDSSEGPLTVPLRRVDPGTSSTVIRRVLLLVHTQWSGGGYFPGGDTGTDNWYLMDAPVPFTRGEVQAGGRIVLSILGDDAWKPMWLFVFGLDTASGRPNQVVSLVSRPVWGPRGMSTDTTEGDPSVDLQVTPG